MKEKKDTFPKRKILLIDRKFQLKTAFTLTGVVLFFLSLIIASMSLVMVNNNRQLGELYRQQEGLTFNQKEIVESLLVFNRVRTWENLRLATDRATRDLQSNTEQIEGNQALIKRVIFHNKLLLLAIAAIAMVQLFIIFRMLIRKTHRISGPVFLLGRYMDELIKGKYPAPRPLREGDELTALYEKFGEVVKTVQERDEKRKKENKRLKEKVKELKDVSSRQ